MNYTERINHYITEGIKSFDTNRLIYYGIAILLVIFYHALCFGHSFIAFKIFKYGFIGVDIFLFFSGYGLCYSYEKSCLVDFYKKRALRILPLFVIYAVFKSAMLTFFGKETLSAWDWLCNVTTLSYYQIGGVFIDWYLCALLLLYITFPVFRLFVKYSHIIGLIVIAIICCWILMQVDFLWIHQCLIGRLPIFYFGVLMYDLTRHNAIDIKLIKIMLYIFLFFGILAIFIGGNKFFISTLFSPFLLFFSYFFLKKMKLNKSFVSNLCLLGNKSLEIYLGNCTALIFVRYIQEPPIAELLIYFILTFLASIIYIKINETLLMTKH